MLHLSENIKTIRQLSNKTQFEFAALFNVKDKKGNPSKDKINSYESDRATAPEWLVEYIAEFARVSVDDLKNKKLSKKDIDLGPDELGQVVYDKVEPALLLKDNKATQNDELLQSYKAHIKSLEKINEGLEKRLAEIEFSLSEMRTNQAVTFALLREVATQAVSYRYATKKEKYDSAVNEINKVVASFHK